MRLGKQQIDLDAISSELVSKIPQTVLPKDSQGSEGEMFNITGEVLPGNVVPRVNRIITGEEKMPEPITSFNVVKPEVHLSFDPTDVNMSLQGFWADISAGRTLKSRINKSDLAKSVPKEKKQLNISQIMEILTEGLNLENIVPEGGNILKYTKEIFVARIEMAGNLEKAVKGLDDQVLKYLIRSTNKTSFERKTGGNAMERQGLIDTLKIWYDHFLVENEKRISKQE